MTNLTDAQKESRDFVEEALRAIPWAEFRAEMYVLELTGVLSPKLASEARYVMAVIVRKRLFWDEQLSPKDYVETARILEEIADAAFGQLDD